MKQSPATLLPASLALLLFGGTVMATPNQVSLPPETAMNAEAGRGGNLFVTLQLEGGRNLRFALDTGTSMTILDKSLESSLGKKTGAGTFSTLRGYQDLNLYAAPKLYWSNCPFLHGTTVATRRFRNHMGILGMDCLSNYCIQLDFGTGKIRFLEADKIDPAGLGQAFPITFREDCPFLLHASLTGQGTNKYARIDTGFNLDGRVKVENDRNTAPHRVALASCVWEGETYTNLSVITAGDGANLIGLRFLARHVVTFNFPKGTMYLRKISTGPLARTDASQDSSRKK